MMPAEGGRGRGSGSGEGDEFYRRLYDEKTEYVARRNEDSLEARLIRLEVEAFKVPNLVSVIPPGFAYGRVTEIGCATGELLAAFPAPPRASKVGYDISPENIRCARARHAGIDFRNSDFRSFERSADIVILSDVLEHVPDDRGMLQAAGELGRLVLINLPLEDNWLNGSRAYGPDDVSGHLRRYSLADGLALIGAAGLRVLHWRQLWIHESDCEVQRRRVRKEVVGSAFAGGKVARAGRRCAWSAARLIQPLGRRLFASNLFASASRLPGP